MASKRPPPDLRTRARTLAASSAGRILLRLLAVAIVLAGTGLIVRQARARALKLKPYWLGAHSVRYLDLDPDLGPLVERSLTDPGWVPLRVSVFDADAEEKIREVIARHPVVSDVQSVEIRYPDRVLVRVKVREPAAWFAVPGAEGARGYLLVSEDARVLERSCYRHYLRRLRVPLPKVVGVRARPPEWLGEVWEDLPEQVAEGIAASRVAEKLYRDFKGTVYVERIDVGSFPAPPSLRRQGEVRLVLHDGTVVEWGRSDRDLDGVASEDTYETKRWRLATALTRRAAGTTTRIDVRFRLPGEGRPPTYPR